MNPLQNLLHGLRNLFNGHAGMMKIHTEMEKEGWQFQYFYPAASFAPPGITVVAPNGERLSSEEASMETHRAFWECHNRCAAKLGLS